MSNTIADSIFMNEQKARSGCAVTDGQIILATVDLGKTALDHFRSAISLARNPMERRFLEQRARLQAAGHR